MKSFIVRVTREPLVHFALIGLAIFLIFDLMDDTPPDVGTTDIIVSIQTADRLAKNYESVWRRAPNAEEMDGLIDNFVREEVLVREALALGLDRNDTVIRNRLRQKMEFLASAAVGASVPTDDVLGAYYAENKDDFFVEGSLALVQVFLGPSPDDASTQAIMQALEKGQDPGTLGVRTLMPSSLPLSARATVDNTFGRGFYQSLLAIEVGIWSEPLRSGYGYHLVHIDQKQPGYVPELTTVKAAVQRQWLESQAEILEQAYFQKVLEQYNIVRPDQTVMAQP